MPQKPVMTPIDLTLAINFIPAVVCLCKAALISLSLSVLHPGEHLGGFVLLAVMLNIDRAVSHARIFDENAVQGCILAAWGINFLRTTVPDVPKVLSPATAFLWVCFACCLVMEPKKIQEFFVIYGHGAGGVFRRTLPGIITGLFMVVVVFIPFKGETPLITGARSIGFACLCVAWVYVVSIWRPKPRHNGSCVFECHLLLSRFSPILYMDQGVAAFYALGCVVILAYHYIHLHVMASDPVDLSMSTMSTMSTMSNLPNELPGYEHLVCKAQNETRLTVSAPILVPQSTSVKSPIKPSMKPSINSSLNPSLNSSSNSAISASMLTSITEMNSVEEDEDLEAYFRTACQSRQQQ
jgi:hypothetical protein